MTQPLDPAHASDPPVRRYRAGGHWGRTLVREGFEPADEQGRRPDDALLGLLDSIELCGRIAALLNADDATMRDVFRQPATSPSSLAACARCGQPLSDDNCPDVCECDQLTAGPR